MLKYSSNVRKPIPFQLISRFAIHDFSSRVIPALNFRRRLSFESKIVRRNGEKRLEGSEMDAKLTFNNCRPVGWKNRCTLVDWHDLAGRGGAGKLSGGGGRFSIIVRDEDDKSTITSPINRRARSPKSTCFQFATDISRLGIIPLLYARFRAQ